MASSVNTTPCDECDEDDNWKPELPRTSPAHEVVDARGYRFLSARQLLPFEDWHWFYKLSTALGQRFPALSPEANVVLQKRTHAPSPSAKPFDFE